MKNSYGNQGNIQKYKVSNNTVHARNNNELYNPYKEFEKQKETNGNFAVICFQVEFETLKMSVFLVTLGSQMKYKMYDNIQVTRFIIMKSQNRIMGICDSKYVRLLYYDDKETNTLLNSIIIELENTFNAQLKETMSSKERINDSILECVLIFTILCKYLESTEWIHYGDNMSLLVEKKFSHWDPKKKTYEGGSNFNCIGFQFKQIFIESKAQKKQNKMYHLDVILILEIDIYKVLPVEDNIDENSFVYCLPRCCFQSRVQDVAIRENGTFDFKEYWRFVHGYTLTDNDIRKIFQVQLFRGCLNYPIGTLLREKLFKIQTQIKHSHIKRVSNYLLSFELLKNAPITNVTFSESQYKDDIKNYIIEYKKEKKDKCHNFYSQLQELCNNQCAVKQEVLDSHSQSEETIVKAMMNETINDNVYGKYRNTIICGNTAINLNTTNGNTMNKEKPTSQESSNKINSKLGEIYQCFKKNEMTPVERIQNIQEPNHQKKRKPNISPNIHLNDCAIDKFLKDTTNQFKPGSAMTAETGVDFVTEANRLMNYFFTLEKKISTENITEIDQAEKFINVLNEFGDRVENAKKLIQSKCTAYETREKKRPNFTVPYPYQTTRINKKEEYKYK